MEYTHLSTDTTYGRENQTITPTSAEEEYITTSAGTAFGILILCLFNLSCVTGNGLVIITVILIEPMRAKVSNLLIVSLAAIDMLVGVGVMPLGILYRSTGKWSLGRGACIAWVTLDVTLCTASIVNLTMIALDKYLCITLPFRNRDVSVMVSIYCIIIWGMSITIGVTPLVVGWYPVYDDGKCDVNHHIGYQIYATVGAFYLPLIIMLVVYIKIFKISWAIVQADAKNRPNVIPLDDAEEAMTTSESKDMERCLQTSSTLESNLVAGNSDSQLTRNGARSSTSERCNIIPQTQTQKPVYSTKKSVRALGIIMGMFIACWLPFFIYALVRTFCKECEIPEAASGLLTWLGYLNSCINPLIYARFHKDFGTPMKEMVFCRWGNVRRSVRRQIYNDQFGD